jgi:hypothetical protein
VLWFVFLCVTVPGRKPTQSWAVQLAVNLMALQSAKEVRLLRADVRTLWKALYAIGGTAAALLYQLV